MDKQGEIEKEVERLKNITDEQLLQYNDELSKKRTAWFAARKTSLKLESLDTMEAAYQLLLRKFGATPEMMPVVRKEKNIIIFHSKNFCPTLEACIILGLDTRKVCKLYNEKATDALIRKIDPALRFERNYKNLRPYSPYCEEMILRGDYDQF